MPQPRARGGAAPHAAGAQAESVAGRCKGVQGQYEVRLRRGTGDRRHGGPAALARRFVVLGIYRCRRRRHDRDVPPNAALPALPHRPLPHRSARRGTRVSRGLYQQRRKVGPLLQRGGRSKRIFLRPCPRQRDAGRRGVRDGHVPRVALPPHRRPAALPARTHRQQHARCNLVVF